MDLLMAMLTKEEVLKRLCKLSTKIATEIYRNHFAADCFCGQSSPSIYRALFVGADDYRFETEVLEFLESAVEEKMEKNA